jgi:hypothetical protein
MNPDFSLTRALETANAPSAIPGGRVMSRVAERCEQDKPKGSTVASCSSGSSF